MGDGKARWLTLLFLIVPTFGSAKMVSKNFWMLPAHNHDQSTGTTTALRLKRRGQHLLSLPQLSLAVSFPLLVLYLHGILLYVGRHVDSRSVPAWL